MVELWLTIGCPYSDYTSKLDIATYLAHYNFDAAEII